MSFKFAKEQRVNVPGWGMAQGVIVDVVETIPGYPVYTLNWLNNGGEKLLGSCGEGDLVVANKPTPIGAIVVDRVITSAERKRLAAAFARKSKRKR